MAKDFASLIGTWPRRTEEDGRELTSIASFAADVGIAYYRAQVMRHRNSIAVEHWPAVVKAAKKRGKLLTHEQLGRMREVSKREVAAKTAAKKTLRYGVREACAS